MARCLCRVGKELKAVKEETSLLILDNRCKFVVLRVKSGFYSKKCGEIEDNWKI